MVILVNPLLKWMKSQGSECVSVFLLSKKIFGEHFKVFHEFVDSADEFLKLFSL